MARISKSHKVAKIHMAAILFATGNKTTESIAEILKVSRDTVIRYSRDAEWHIALDAIEFHNDRTFPERRGRPRKK